MEARLCELFKSASEYEIIERSVIFDVWSVSFGQSLCFVVWHDAGWCSFSISVIVPEGGSQKATLVVLVIVRICSLRLRLS